MLISFTFIATCLYCFCPLCLAIKLNINNLFRKWPVERAKHHDTLWNKVYCMYITSHPAAVVLVISNPCFHFRKLFMMQLNKWNPKT